jgi:hypothetical protein
MISSYLLFSRVQAHYLLQAMHFLGYGKNSAEILILSDFDSSSVFSILDLCFPLLICFPHINPLSHY